MKPKVNYIVNCSLNFHTSHHLDLEFMGPRRHKPNAKLPQCCIIAILLILLKSLCVLVAAEEKRGLKLLRTFGLSKFTSDCELTGTISRNHY